MATEITASIYGAPPLSFQEQARQNAINSVQEAQIYLIKSLDTDDDTEVKEGMELIVKLGKIEKKIKSL